MLGWRRPKATVTGCGSLPHMVAQGHRVTICVEKTRGGGAHHEADVAAMAAPNWWSGAASGAQEGPRELAMHARMVKVARAERKKRGRRRRVQVEAGEGGEGGRGIAIGSAGRPVAAPSHRARAALLLSNRGGWWGVGDAARRD
jgi:hypothetical protein